MGEGREIVLHTDLSPEEALERLRQNVDVWPSWWRLVSRYEPIKREIIGKVLGNSFKLGILKYLAATRRGPSIYTLKGNIEPAAAGTGATISLRVAGTPWRWPWLVAGAVLVIVTLMGTVHGPVHRAFDAIIVAILAVVLFILDAALLSSKCKGDDGKLIGFVRKTLGARSAKDAAKQITPSVTGR